MRAIVLLAGALLVSSSAFASDLILRTEQQQEISFLQFVQPNTPKIQTPWQPAAQSCSTTCDGSSYNASCSDGQSCDCSCNRQPVCQCR